jgi:hypothetical protein
MPNGDPLLQAPLDCEVQLTTWLNDSAGNAELFRCQQRLRAYAGLGL